MRNNIISENFVPRTTYPVLQVERDSIWCVIPIYNNKATLKDIVAGCKLYLKNILVVDDGSTDVDVKNLLADQDVIVLSHQKNKGKGAAIITALKYVQRQGGRHAITIDADGQHIPGDIEKFIELIPKEEDTIVVGSRNFNTDNVPNKSKVGRKIASFWFKVETGIDLDDCQSGFRAYPVENILKLNIKSTRYDFETEVITKAAWAGLKFKTLDIAVHYPKGKNRVTHFRTVVDNLRISHVHALLVLRRLLPIRNKKLVAGSADAVDYEMFKNPIKLFKFLLNENASAGGLAVSAAVGIFLAVLPLIAVHTIVIIYVTARLHLNKVMAVSIQNLCIPPFVPAICIEIGHYLRFGKWLTDVSFEVVFKQMGERIFEWFLGSLIFAPIASIVIGTIVYFIFKILQRPKGEGREMSKLCHCGHNVQKLLLLFFIIYCI